MRRSAVLSLALLVALPVWAAAQVITLPSEPGFGFRDTPPTVPASRLIPAGDGRCRPIERFPRDDRPHAGRSSSAPTCRACRRC